MKTKSEFFYDKVKELSKCKTILDVGGATPFQKYMKKYRWMFADSEYLTLDSNKDTKPDFVSDATKMNIQSNTFDAVISISTLEHINNPQKAIDEIRRVLKKKGKLLMFIPSTYPYHASDSYKDYWRFYKESLQHLTRKFKRIEIEKAGGYFYTVSLFLPNIPLKKKIALILDKYIKVNSNITYGYYLWGEK